MESAWQTALPLKLKNTSSVSVTPPSLQLKDVGFCPCYYRIVVPVGTTSDQNYYVGYMLIRDTSLKTLKIPQLCLCWTLKSM